MKILLVEWIDTACTFGWEHKGCESDLEPSHCISVGVLIRDTEDFITLAESMSEHNTSERISIFKGSIVRVRELKVKNG